MGGGSSRLTEYQRQQRQRDSRMMASSRSIKDEGNEWLIAFDRDGTEMFRNTDNKHGEVSFGSDENWRRGVDHITVHNHPEKNAFSGADVNVAFFVEESWVSTSERVMKFKWNENYFTPNFNSTRQQLRSRAEEFAKKVDEMHDKVWPKAREEYDKKHPMPEYGKVSYEQMTAHLKARAEGVRLLAQQKQRNWFKNNQKKYGYTYSERTWK